MPETAELIEKIDSERERTERFLREVEERLRESSKLSENVARDLKQTEAALQEALKTLRRAGLLRDA